LRRGAPLRGASRSEILSGIENAIGTGFSDELFGGGGGNRLEGRRGADSLGGEGGNDFLFSGNGDDGLDGGAQNDVLTGGLGLDVLFGGGGADRFDFNLATESVANANRDQVQNFDREALDKIDVSGIDANGTVGGIRPSCLSGRPRSEPRRASCAFQAASCRATPTRMPRRNSRSR
jgi:Ca2+-binding RTX toxin-like protein